MTHEIAGLVENLAERHGHPFQVRQHTVAHLGGQGGQKVVLWRRGHLGHGVNLAGNVIPFVARKDSPAAPPRHGLAGAVFATEQTRPGDYAQSGERQMAARH
ncbi:hypothetical protein D3C86_1960680 [compost metagenome]